MQVPRGLQTALRAGTLPSKGGRLVPWPHGSTFGQRASPSMQSLNASADAPTALRLVRSSEVAAESHGANLRF